MALQALHVASLASLHALSARPIHAQTKCGNAIIIQKCQVYVIIDIEYTLRESLTLL